MVPCEGLGPTHTKGSQTSCVEAPLWDEGYRAPLCVGLPSGLCGKRSRPPENTNSRTSESKSGIKAHSLPHIDISDENIRSRRGLKLVESFLLIDGMQVDIITTPPSPLRLI